jgi:aryl-alcohol dehydrogenase-like predicted oxidoreductase
VRNSPGNISPCFSRCSLHPLTPDDFRHTLPRFTGDAFESDKRIVEVVRAIAVRKGITPGQPALAWVLAQGEEIVTIPGTKGPSTWRRTWPQRTSG